MVVMEWGKDKCGKKNMATVAMIPNTDVSALNASVAALAGEGMPYRSAIGHKTLRRTRGSGAGTAS